MKVRFGTGKQKELSGASLSVRAFQIASILPLLYILILSGYPALITSRNIFTYLFELGIMSISRQQTLLISLVYRLFSSEMAVYACILIPALVFGLVSGRILRGSERSRKVFRIVYALWIAADLIIRLVSLIFFPIKLSVWTFLGLAVRLAMLVLIILDIRAGESRD